MTEEMLKSLEDKINLLEFKLELVLKFTKNEALLSLETCKNMDEFAFVNGLQKVQYNKLNELLSTQIEFYQTFKNQTFITSRQYFKSDGINVLDALGKEEFEEAIWAIVPKFKDNHDLCKQIAKINGISEMYYDDQLAGEIKKAKFEKLDRENKLRVSYEDNKDTIDGIYNDLESLKEELKQNSTKADQIVEFFNNNELDKISIFYNGELWDLENGDKKVVINENTYIHNVCDTNKNEILETISNILKEKTLQYKDLMVHLLKSGTASSQKIISLQEFYQLLDKYNKNEYVSVDEIKTLKEKLEANILLVQELINSYKEYVSSLETK